MSEEKEEESHGGVPPKLDLNRAIGAEREAEQPAETPSGPPPAGPEGEPIGPKPPAAPTPPEEVRTTMQIDVDRIIEAETEAGETGLPAGAGPPPRSTVVVRPKKDTTRISLEQALAAEAGGPAQPKTIKIKRPADVATVKRAPGVPQPEEIKKKTSRIRLDAVLGGETEVPAQPKTIRVRREPGGAAQGPAVAAGPDTAVTIKRPLRDTSRVNLVEPADAEEEAPPTQRKTIRVRRATESRRPRAVTTARRETVVRQERIAPETAPVGVGFTIVTAAALVALGVAAYVMTVQAFPHLDLGWPGRILPPSYYNYR